jgi:hypothetical protein
MIVLPYKVIMKMSKESRSKMVRGVEEGWLLPWVSTAIISLVTVSVCCLRELRRVVRVVKVALFSSLSSLRNQAARWS